jgi:hypothetical protein
MKPLRLLLVLIFLLPLAIIYDGQVYAIQPVKNNNQLIPVMDFILEHRQPGDIIYNVGEGSWVALAPSLPEDFPQYVMPECGHTIGGLTVRTQEALGVQFMSLDELRLQPRAWIIYGHSALSAPCEQIFMDAFLGDLQPVVVVEDMVLSYIGIWLYENP